MAVRTMPNETGARGRRELQVLGIGWEKTKPGCEYEVRLINGEVRYFAIETRDT